MTSQDLPTNESRRQLLVRLSALTFLAAAARGAQGAGRAASAVRLPVPDYRPADTFFGPAYIDVDEWHSTPVRFRYVHGGFEGTDTRFSIYFPEPARYQDRFFQVLPGGVGGEDTAVLDAVKAYDAFGVVPPIALLMAFDQRAYLVESNQGHLGNDMSGLKAENILAFRASTETARFGRVLATQMYGKAPKRGYIYGGSGGAVRSINCLEANHDVWDGAVPIVAPCQSAGTFFSPLLNAVRLLGPEKIAALSDAVEVGGSGRPFEGLYSQQADALRVLYQCGYPRDIGIDNPREAVLVWTYHHDTLIKTDPAYFDDFWNKPGYLGHDEPELLAPDVIEVRLKVKRVLTAGELASYAPPFDVVDARGMGGRSMARTMRGNRDSPAAIVVDAAPATLSRMGCSSMTFTSGVAKGRERFVFGVFGDALIAGGLGAELLEGVRAGDEVKIDNRKYLAFCYFYRHQVEPEFREWSHAVMDGQPIYPQRTVPEYPAAKFPYTFAFRDDVKLIFVSSLSDRGVFASSFASILDQIERVRGTAFRQNNTRVWLNEHAWHGGVPAPTPDEQAPVLATRLINYMGSVSQAMKALVAWVERGEAPLPSSVYTYTQDCNIVVPATAAARKGIQPVVRLSANGRSGRVEVARGQPVTFTATAEMPPQAGYVTTAEWDFDGRGTYPGKSASIGPNARQARLTTTHTYAAPGTYFPSVRVTGHPQGTRDEPIYSLPNLGRIRVVVT